jgi:hypothetical protein
VNDILETQHLDKWSQPICHCLCGVWVDDEYGPHCGVSCVDLVAVLVFAHWFLGWLLLLCSYVCMHGGLTPLRSLPVWRIA